LLKKKLVKHTAVEVERKKKKEKKPEDYRTFEKGEGFRAIAFGDNVDQQEKRDISNSRHDGQVHPIVNKASGPGRSSKERVNSVRFQRKRRKKSVPLLVTSENLLDGW